MNRKPYKTLPTSVWIAFAGICLLGIVTGLAGGAGQLSDVVFGIGLFGVPTIFIIWAVAKLDPRSLGEITGHDRWREEQSRREGIHEPGDEGSRAETQRKWLR